MYERDMHSRLLGVYVSTRFTNVSRSKWQFDYSYDVTLGGENETSRKTHEAPRSRCTTPPERAYRLVLSGDDDANQPHHGNGEDDGNIAKALRTAKVLRYTHGLRCSISSTTCLAVRLLCWLSDARTRD